MFKQSVLLVLLYCFPIFCIWKIVIRRLLYEQDNNLVHMCCTLVDEKRYTIHVIYLKTIPHYDLPNLHCENKISEILRKWSNREYKFHEIQSSWTCQLPKVLLWIFLSAKVSALNVTDTSYSQKKIKVIYY